MPRRQTTFDDYASAVSQVQSLLQLLKISRVNKVLTDATDNPVIDGF